MIFCNEGIEQLNLKIILKSKISNTRLPGTKQLSNNIPVVTSRLTPVITNKILSYEGTVKSIIVDDENSYFSAGTCNCETYSFHDEHYGHLIAGDQRLIANTKLRSLLSKVTSYKEPNTIKYSNCKIVR